MTASLSTSTSTGSLPAGVSSLSTGLSTTDSTVADLSTSISTTASSLLSTLPASTFASVSSLSTVVSASATHYYSVNDSGSTLDNHDNRGATGSYAVAVGADASAARASAVALGNGATASWDGAIAIGHAAAAQNGRAAYTGIPAATALTMIPEVDRGKTLAIGIGTGSYQGYSAAALGFSAQIANNLKIKGGVNGGAGGYSYGAAASYQW